MTDYKGVILDVDGTLVDSNDAHAYSWLTALAEHGYPTDFDSVRRLIGMGGDNLLPETAKLEKDSEQGKRITERYLEVFKNQYLPTLKAIPGARDLVERLLAHNLKIVVGSSSEASVLNTLLQIANVDTLLDLRVEPHEAKNSKPDPDIALAALNKLELPPEQVVMIGDTPYDIITASKAKIGTIALRCGGWSDNVLQDALAIYDNPVDLVTNYDQSPLAERVL